MVFLHFVAENQRVILLLARELIFEAYLPCEFYFQQISVISEDTVLPSST